jgi:hypothetical protein
MCRWGESTHVARRRLRRHASAEDAPPTGAVTHLSSSQWPACGRDVRRVRPSSRSIATRPGIRGPGPRCPAPCACSPVRLPRLARHRLEVRRSPDAAANGYGSHRRTSPTLPRTPIDARSFANARSRVPHPAVAARSRDSRSSVRRDRPAEARGHSRMRDVKVDVRRPLHADLEIQKRQRDSDCKRTSLPRWRHSRFTLSVRIVLNGTRDAERRSNRSRFGTRDDDTNDVTD